MSAAGTVQRAGLEPLLDSLIQLIEQQNAGMRCSILLLDEDGVTLRHGAAPNLPKHYREAIDGLRIGPGAGSCGTAAFERELTIVDDIATHEYWAAFRDLALPCGLRACWSTPILGSNDLCLGTFAMYYDEPRAPSDADVDVIRTASLLASALIEREIANQQLQESAAELEALNQQLQENATELEMQTDELEQARVEAEHANRVKSTFLATMSHELRTPLNAISGYADLLLTGVRGDLNPNQRRDVERIQRSGSHLLGLINDLLQFARLEAGRVEFRIEDLCVGSLLGDLEELVRPEIDARSLVYACTLPPEGLRLRGDADKVRRILLNLLTNAVKFTEPRGRISVTIEAHGDAVCIRVNDTGCGIAAEDLLCIFEPFVQVGRYDTPVAKRGVGLGLSISRELAHAMGGSLTAVSTTGVGSTFTLMLPRAEALSVVHGKEVFA